MRTRRVIATLIAGAMLATISALATATPSSAETPPGFMRCEINWIDRGDDGDLGVDPSGRPFECYY